MKRLKLLALSIMSMGILAAPVLVPVTADAAICSGDAISCAQGGAGASGQSGGVPLATFLKNIVNILLYLIGAIAVIVIIIGGLRYVTSGGDSSQMTAAKNTILYAVIGVIVAILAYAIVNFVLQNVK